jgi:phosphatidylethanolamine/phosphatidyl-N-methylethanolamine N-methyltransferase
MQGREIVDMREREASETDRIARIYARWAPVYDLVFGALMEGSRAAAVRAVPKGARRVLEVGVGTGVSLPLYPRAVRVTGIDVSPEMLARARNRVSAHDLRNVEALTVMDAGHLAFEDAAFDVAMAMYVLTVVPDVEGVVAELRRVVGRGGRIITVGRFAAERGPGRAVSGLLQPLWRSLGWTSGLSAEALARLPGLRLVRRRPVGPFGYYTLLEFEVA